MINGTRTLSGTAAFILMLCVLVVGVNGQANTQDVTPMSVAIDQSKEIFGPDQTGCSASMYNEWTGLSVCSSAESVRFVVAIESKTSRGFRWWAITMKNGMMQHTADGIIDYQGF